MLSRSPKIVTLVGLVLTNTFPIKILHEIDLLIHK